MLAAGDNDGVIWVWRIGRLWTKPVNFFVGHQGSVDALVFSPDSRLVASGGLDKRVLVWETSDESETPLESYDGLSSCVRQITFLEEGKKLLAVAQDGHCLVWDRSTRAKTYELSLGQALAVQVAVSPNGKSMAIASSDGTITLYRLGDAPAAATPPKGQMPSPRTKSMKTDSSSEQTKRTRIIPAKAADGKS